VPEGFAALIHCKISHKISWSYEKRIITRFSTKFILAKDHVVVKEVNRHSVGMYSCYAISDTHEELVGISKLSMGKFRELIFLKLL